MTYRLAAIVLPLCAAISACAHASAQPEFRVLQVQTWIPGMLSRQEIDDTVKWAKDANFNVVVLQARTIADAYYDSAYEPRSANIKDPGFDPMAYGIKKCRENGLQVYAWFVIYRVWKGGRPADPRHIANLHPEWLNKDYDSNPSYGDSIFLDPGVPEVRDYTVELIGDFLGKYDVDGIMLDYVRYPGNRMGYNETAVARFNVQYERTGKPDPEDLTWGRWRREQVTGTLLAIRREVERQKPHVVLSAATIPWGTYFPSWAKADGFRRVFQDWRMWMEDGLIDVNISMNYKDPSKPRDEGWYEDWLGGIRNWEYNRQACSAIMVYGDNVDGAVEQIRLAREHGLGIAGLAFSQIDCKDKLAAALKARVFQEPAPVPELPWKRKRTR